MSSYSGKMNAFLRKAFLAIIDALLFFAFNVAICYISYNKNVFLSDYYRFLLFNPWHIVITLSALIGINYSFKLYKSIWSFAGPYEVATCAVSSVVNAAMLFLIDKLFSQMIYSYATLPVYAYFFNLIFIFFGSITPRLGYRFVRSGLKDLFAISKQAVYHTNKILIVGAGYTGNAVIEDLRLKESKKGFPVAAVDDNPTKYRKRLNGIKIVGTIEDIPKVVEKYEIDEIIICIPSASRKRINEIIEIASKTNKPIKITPSFEEILESSNKEQLAHTRSVNISDLLSRDEVRLDLSVCKYLINSTILVTGGGGSIGSEICNQCARYSPKAIIIFDIYENCAFELKNDLEARYGDKIKIFVRIGSVRDIDRLEEIFEEFHPDVVFHAAAHKHVPLMEESPCEAVKNNVFGTYNVALTADKYKASKMVILSTDKAVNPTNVMGATKRITEIIVQYMNNICKDTKFAAVRFGNVLGSHGSVIPIFEKQIAAGGPVCVTHPYITRYFMTIPEAAQLVCQAGGLAQGGEVFVLDMGEPVKIMDLAKKIIQLSGHTLDEIGIKITGLRPGEKLYEELSLDSELETRKKTANEKIFVNQPMNINYERFKLAIDSLKDINEDNVREKLTAILPNYIPAKNQ